MDIPLTLPSTPISLLETPTTTTSTTIWLRNHDRHLQNSTIISDDGEKLFSVQGAGPYRSWTFRRPVKFTTNAPAFDLRRSATDPKMSWFVDNAAGAKIAEVEHLKFFTRAHTAIDAKLLDAQGGVRAVVEMRPRDHVASTTYVNVNGAVVAEISLHINNTPKRFNGDKDLSVFRVRVAEGVDIALVVLMALVRAEMAHIWRK